MKRKILIFTTLATFAIAGCSASSSPDSTKTDNLKKQVEDLKKENEELKSKLGETTENAGSNADDTKTKPDDAETKADNAEKSEKPLKIGKEGTLGDWSVTVTAAEIVDSINNGYSSFNPSEGNKYFNISLSIKNNGKSAAIFLKSYSFGDDIQAKLLYGDGYEFSATNLLGHKKSLHDETLNPLSSKDGTIAFEIPNDVAESDKKIILQFTIGDESLRFKVR